MKSQGKKIELWMEKKNDLDYPVEYVRKICISLYRRLKNKIVKIHGLYNEMISEEIERKMSPNIPINNLVTTKSDNIASVDLKCEAFYSSKLLACSLPREYKQPKFYEGSVNNDVTCISVHALVIPINLRKALNSLVAEGC